MPCDPPDSTFVEREIADIEAYVQDTVHSVEAKNRRFYENLEKSAQSNKFAKWLHSMLIVTPKNRSDEDVVDEKDLYERYAGRPIVSVEVENKPIFDYARSHLQKAMEGVHSNTWKYTIRRDLLFSAGDELDPDVLVRNKRLLQSRGYFYDTQIVVEPYPQDTSAVVVRVITRDKWTIGVDGSIKGFKDGHMNGDIFDYNFLGGGNTLKYRLSLNWKEKFYRGSYFQYYIPNLMKSFYEAELQAGRTDQRNRYYGSLHKKFLLPTDYELGGRIGWEKNNVRDFGVPVGGLYRFSAMEYDVWTGKSFQLRPEASSIYGMVRFHDMNYKIEGYNTGDEIQPVGPEMHPDLHDRRMVLGSIGLYKENFLATNLIYGYGFTEYISTGFKAELSGGYSWEEFGEGWYAAVQASAGGFSPIGYFAGTLWAGSYLNYEGRDFFRSAVSMDLIYFTNLIDLNRYNQFRQFLRVNATAGFNRVEGIGEYLRFNPKVGPRFFYDRVGGHNRLVLSTESVMFTPWIPIGFRMALFAFGDFGWIGNDRNFFKNDFYTNVGFGIRLKNEMLVFSTIEISINFAFDKNGWRNTTPVYVGGERRIPVYRFTPEKPRIVEYR